MKRGSEIQSQYRKKNFTRLVFLVSLFLLAWLYNYPDIAFKRPQSVHHWRQSDCGSLALNFYQNGMKFFQPEVHGMISAGASTGKAATSETPVFYYGIALLYKVFGYHDYIYRILVTLIFLFGLYSLFMLFNRLNIDPVWSISLSLIFFASPVLVYYGNNFLTDIPALSFSLAGWNHVLGYYQHRREASYGYAMIFLLLAMLMKISAGISVVTLLLIFLLEYTGILKSESSGSLFPKKGSRILPLLLILMITGAWAIYASLYNIRHECTYFSTTTFPIWNMSLQEISDALKDIRLLWLNQYFHPATLVFFIVLFVFNMIHLKKADRLLMVSGIILFTGVVAYCLLWFGTFGNHDYYTINLYIFPVMIALGFADVMNRIYPAFSRNFFVRGLLVLFLAFNVQHTRTQMNIRYNGWWNEYPAFRDYYSITPYLRSVGITRFDSVVCMPDQNHHTLYLMNQPGWAIKDYPVLTRQTGIRDSLAMIRNIELGAKFLVTHDIHALARHVSLVPYTRTLYAKYNSIFIFSLPPRETNFVLSDSMRQLLHIVCDAERIDSTRSYAGYDEPTYRAVAGGYISVNTACSGVKSIMLNETRPYGFTTSLKAGTFDRVTISASQYPLDKACYLVISSQDGSKFNVAQQEIVADKGSGWIRIRCQVDLPSTLDTDSIKVFFWNTGKNNVFVDDFTVQIERNYEFLKNGFEP